MAVAAEGVSIAETVAAERATAASAGGGFVEATGLFAEEDELDEVEESAFAGAVGTGDECQAVDVDELAVAVPVDGDDAGDYNDAANDGALSLYMALPSGWLPTFLHI